MSLKFHKLHIVAFLILNLKQISFCQNNNKPEGKCNNFNDIGCIEDNNCPGYCDNQSHNPGSICTSNKECERGGCIYNQCIIPIGFCFQNKNLSCKSNNDCSVCSVKSQNVGDKCKNSEECKNGKCMNNINCIFPTGFCEGDKTVCGDDTDCPGSCSFEANNPGDSCVTDSQCKGKKGVCVFERCIPKNLSTRPTISPTKARTESPTYKPTILPTSNPTNAPTNSPTSKPTNFATNKPTDAFTSMPTPGQTNSPTPEPTNFPTNKPTDAFTSMPTPAQTNSPTTPEPTNFLTNKPTDAFTSMPTPGQTNSPTPEPTNFPTKNPTPNPSSKPSSQPTDLPSVKPSLKSSPQPSRDPSSKSSEMPSLDPSSKPSESNIRPNHPSLKPAYMPSGEPSAQPFRVPSSKPSDNPSSRPSNQPLPVTLEEALLSDKLFGPSSSICSNYMPKNGEYSFTFNLTKLLYFDNTLSDIEKVMFQVQMGHTDSNSNRTWSIKIGKGGNIYSFKGPYGESIPPNKKVGMQFVDEVNQKVSVDSAKNQAVNGNGYFVHQAGVYQDGDTGYTDKMPFWFSPNVAIYCSTSVPECRLASWGQQSYVRAWTERIIYYDRYRDCGDGILERTHLIHNAEVESTNTVLTFTNMPWGGTRYTTLKDFVFSQNPDTWDYGKYNLTGGMEDPMLIFGIDSSYGSNVVRDVYSTWTWGYTIFAQDLPFVTTPSFKFPGRLPPQTDNQLTLIVDYGTLNTNWICQGPLTGYTKPDYGNYRCRMKNLGATMSQGCIQCYLRFTNKLGDSFSVFNVRNWLVWTSSVGCNLIYFNSKETLTKILQVMTNGATITVSWDETGMRPEDNLSLAFVHGRSERMILDNKNRAKIRFGHANNVERDFAVFEYISYPNLKYGDSFRARQYYITDRYTGLSERSAALVNESIEEVIESGEFDFSDVHLHYVDDGKSNSFGSTIDDDACRNTQTTTIACTGSSTPQLGKFPLLQIDCGSSTYVGMDFYHFSNFPTTPYRVMNCKMNGVTTSTRPSVKLLGYFSKTVCGTVLQDKTYDEKFCNNQ